MANLIYMTLTGEKQGLISQGCGTYDSMGNKYQASHQDQIFLLALTHSTHRAQNVCHQPVSVTKLVDKSSPLLGVAIANNEKLQCNFDILRTNKTGMNSKYYSIELRDAFLIDVSLNFPHSVDHNGAEAEETLIFTFNSITWQHHQAGTSGYSFWQDIVM
ncbi:Hcp family type VI secretion system effector [Rahnella bruchi]|uniref:Hcp family type VI secretion system effector n=1 Tax=Rahnella bruchi TaxID=1510573 RepID=UPI000EA34BA8|nr:Hcp family type VI secretion system effector [Rahnella bruchi]